MTVTLEDFKPGVLLAIRGASFPVFSFPSRCYALDVSLNDRFMIVDITFQETEDEFTNKFKPAIDFKNITWVQAVSCDDGEPIIGWIIVHADFINTTIDGTNYLRFFHKVNPTTGEVITGTNA